MGRALSFPRARAARYSLVTMSTPSCPQPFQPRRVFVTLELETDAPLDVLKDHCTWDRAASFFRADSWACLQASANVAVVKKPKKARRKA